MHARSLWCRVLVGGLILGLSAAVTERADAQPFTQQYVIPFTCVLEVGPENTALEQANYRTAIGMLNTQPGVVRLQKRAAWALDEPVVPRGFPGPWRGLNLAPFRPVYISCLDIAQVLLPGAPIPAVPVGNGFVVLQSELPIHVWAVYTAEILTADTAVPPPPGALEQADGEGPTARFGYGPFNPFSGAGLSIDVEHIAGEPLPPP